MTKKTLPKNEPRSFAGTRGEFGDLSEIFFAESDENAKKNFAFWRLGASFLHLLSGWNLSRAGTFLGENFFPKNQFSLSEMMVARTKRSKQLSVLPVFSVENITAGTLRREKHVPACRRHFANHSLAKSKKIRKNAGTCALFFQKELL